MTGTTKPYRNNDTGATNQHGPLLDWEATRAECATELATLRAAHKQAQGGARQ